MKVLEFFKELFKYGTIVPIWFYTGVLCATSYTNIESPKWWGIVCAAVSIGSAIAEGIFAGELEYRQENKGEIK